MEFMSDRNLNATATHVTDCVTATSLLQLGGDAASRTADENFLMVINNLQTLGVVANLFADTDNDGTLDPAYRTCTDIDNTNADYIAEAMWELDASSGSTGIPELAAFGTLIDGFCTALQGANAATNFCNSADPDSFTTDHYRGAKAAFREDAVNFGLDVVGDCAGNPITACICP